MAETILGNKWLRRGLFGAAALVCFGCGGDTNVKRLMPAPPRIAVPPVNQVNASPVADAAPDYAAHAARLRAQLPDTFTVVIEPPFVVIGDGSPESVRGTARSTVRWAATKLKESYFSKDPATILDVWLFKDRASYQRHTKARWGSVPDTPYGYYSANDRVLVMNIATGGGTLVHEIVHPYIEANFPHCPSWFNEGLGSLYEQSAERDGKIVGLTNWRLAGLQEAIRAATVPSFERLMATSEDDFYNQDRGTNYAQSRYLLYFLQERGLLRRYYREFFNRRTEDATGIKTLRAVLSEPDLRLFQAQWEKWVLDLRFP